MIKHKLALTFWESLTHWWAQRVAASRGERVSAEWLNEQERQSSRVIFDGPRWAWPINKRVNESGKWNARKLRKGA